MKFAYTSPVTGWPTPIRCTVGILLWCAAMPVITIIILILGMIFIIRGDKKVVKCTKEVVKCTTLSDEIVYFLKQCRTPTPFWLIKFAISASRDRIRDTLNTLIRDGKVKTTHDIRTHPEQRYYL